MNEDWIKEAVASQEEHIKRNTSCRGRIGQAHKYRPHGSPKTGESYDACIVCGVPREARPGALARQA